MKISTTIEKKAKKKMILGAVVFLSALCITFNSLPMTAEGSSTREEKTNNSEIIVEHENEFEKEKVVEQNASGSALDYVRAAQVYADLFRYAEGLHWAEEALRLDPGLPEAHLIYGYLKFKMVYSDEAIAAFERVIELNPSIFEAYNYLGIIYRGAGKPKQGIEYFNQALEVANTSEQLSIGHAERGLAYGNLHQYDDSFKDLDAALRMNPDNGWAVFYRGILIEQQANQEQSAQGQDMNPLAGAGTGFGP